MKNNRKRIWQHIFLICVLAVVAMLGCPIYRLFGVPCPLCGTTRAWVSFLTGKMELAFRYHPFFLITPLWFFAVIHYSCIFKKNKVLGAFLILVALALAVMNVMRITGLLSWPG